MAKRWAVLVWCAVILIATPWAAWSDEIVDLKRAAAAGDAEAQYQLGVKYEYGQGVDKDYGKAAEWTRKSADQGNANAQYNMGLMYEFGQGVGKSLTEAENWYAKAEAQGMKGAAQARTILEHKRNPPAAPNYPSSRPPAVQPQPQAAGDPRAARPSPFGGRGQDRLRDYQRTRDQATKDKKDR